MDCPVGRTVGIHEDLLGYRHTVMAGSCPGSVRVLRYRGLVLSNESDVLK